MSDVDPDLAKPPRQTVFKELEGTNDQLVAALPRPGIRTCPAREGRRYVA
jgi:hypothetical protein